MQILTPTSLLLDWTAHDIPSRVLHADNSRIGAMMRDVFPFPYTPEDAYLFIAMAKVPGPNLFLAMI